MSHNSAVISRLIQASSPKAWLWMGVFASFAWLVVPILHLVAPEGSALHLSAYAVGLMGKILCYMVVAVAMDLVWGYAGILSLGHGLFFA